MLGLLQQSKEAPIPRPVQVQSTFSGATLPACPLANGVACPVATLARRILFPWLAPLRTCVLAGTTFGCVVSLFVACFACVRISCFLFSHLSPSLPSANDKVSFPPKTCLVTSFFEEPTFQLDK